MDAAVIALASVSVGGRYILDEELGEGGMGRVYRARHAKLGKVFALKIIAPAFAEDSIARARFLKEAHLASQISHPGIAQVIDFGEDPSVGAYMVMELVEGESVAREVSVRKALDVIAQLADVLEHIHANNIVHGDIKLENILLVNEVEGARRRQTVKLLDFGLAERMGARRAQLNGTPQYVAPELVQGESPTVSSDIYALGVLTFRLLTGAYPFDGDMEDVLRAHLTRQPPSMGEAVDPALETLVHRALAKSPEDRHPTVSAFRYELKAVMDMLALTKPRKRSSVNVINRRDALIASLFEKTSFPQAIVHVNGEINLANAAFGQLLSCDLESLECAPLVDTTLGAIMPDLLDALHDVYESSKPVEQRARVQTEDTELDIVVWVGPFSHELLHMLVRVETLGGG